MSFALIFSFKEYMSGNSRRYRHAKEKKQCLDCLPRSGSLLSQAATGHATQKTLVIDYRKKDVFWIMVPEGSVSPMVPCACSCGPEVGATMEGRTRAILPWQPAGERAIRMTKSF